MEVQINVCAPPDGVIQALSLTPDASRSRTVWYFDDGALGEYARGLVFRLRSGPQERQLTVKAGVSDCSAVAPALIPSSQGKCERDAHGDTVTAAVSLNADLDESTVARLLDGTARLDSALSAAQVRFLQSRPGAWPLSPGVRPLGPVSLSAYEPGAGRFIAEIWRLEGDQSYVEVSQKARPADVPGVRAEIVAELQNAGLAPCEDQSTRAGEKLRILNGVAPTGNP